MEVCPYCGRIGCDVYDENAGRYAHLECVDRATWRDIEAVKEARKYRNA